MLGPEGRVELVISQLVIRLVILQTGGIERSERASVDHPAHRRSGERDGVERVD
jgi:hypothetical protein